MISRASIAIAAFAAIALAIASGTARAQQACGGEIIPVALIPAHSGPLPSGCGPGIVLLPGNASGPVAHYTALALPACGAGACDAPTPGTSSAFRCQVANGYGCCLAIGQVLSLLPTNVAGPLHDGIGTRFESDSDARTGICHADYAGNGRRIAIVPVISGVGSGGTTVTIVDFARVFMRMVPVTGGAPSLGLELVDGVTPTHGTTWGQLKVAYR